MQVKPYPHVVINVADLSIFEPVASQDLPLFRPLFITTAEKGPLNIPIWCPSIVDARKYFGDKTFDPTSVHYTREAAYLRKVFENSGAFIARIAPTNIADDAVSAEAAPAGCVLELHVAEKDIPQYETYADGSRVVADGDFVPIDGADIAGIEASWVVRPLRSDEDPIAMTKYGEGDGAYDTVTTGEAPNEVEWTIYPMMVFYAANPGAWANSAGFSLYYNTSANGEDQFNRVGAPFYTFAPVLKDDNGVTGTVRDIFTSTFNNFVIKPNVTDPATAANVSIDSVLETAYANGRLPYEIKVFSDNFETVGDLLIAKETEEAYVPWAFEDGAATYNMTWTVGGEANPRLLTVVDGDTTGIEEDMAVKATGIPDGAIVEEVDADAGTVLISMDATDSAVDGELGDEVTIDTPVNSQYEFDADYDGWMINLVNGIDPENDVHYQRFIVTENADLLTELKAKDVDYAADYALASLTEGINHFLSKGSDGTWAEDGEEAYLSAFLAGTLTNADGTFANLEDDARFPFNYLFDCGYTLDIKKDMLDFMNTRDDVRVSVGAYIPGETNSMIINLSTGQELRNYAVLLKESVAKGTVGCRASVWVQSGELIDEATGNLYSTNIWDAWVHAKFQNRGALNKEAAGLPNAAVTLFKEMNWVPSAAETKSLFWNQGVNYLQYYSMTGLYFPGIQTVYEYETSVLKNNMFVDAVVYAKQVIRALYPRYAGVTEQFDVISTAIRDDLITAVNTVFGGKYTFDVKVYQTDEEKQLGFITHILLEVTAPVSQRVWMVDINTKRENYEVA